MNAKTILVLCASALHIQSAAGHCYSRWDSDFGGCGSDGLCCGGRCYDGLAHDGWSGSLICGPAGELGASYVGGLSVTNASPIAPADLTVISNIIYEGCLGVTGNLPFLGTTNVEGVFPTRGAGEISYSSGDGTVGIAVEGPVGDAFGYGVGLGCGDGCRSGPGVGLSCGYGPGVGLSCGDSCCYGPAVGLGCSGGYGPGLGYGYNGVSGCEYGCAYAY